MGPGNLSPSDIGGLHLIALRRINEMRRFDMTPLYRATVGFDQIADLMDRALASAVGTPTLALRHCGLPSGTSDDREED